jgi:cyclic-di-GMP-binding protein
MPSFDIVSELDLQEADNAVNQARKEIGGRYDFKGSKAEIQWDHKELTLLAEDDYKIEAMKGILQTRMHRRGLDIKAFEFGKVEEAGGRLLRQKVLPQQGINKELAKEVIQLLKETKLKIQPQVVDEKVRVTAKSIDDLQAAIQVVKAHSFKLPLQFNNMRS